MNKNQEIKADANLKKIKKDFLISNKLKTSGELEGIKPTPEEIKLEMEWINSMISTSIDYDDLRNIATELIISKKQLIQEKDAELNKLKEEIRSIYSERKEWEKMYFNMKKQCDIFRRKCKKIDELKEK